MNKSRRNAINKLIEQLEEIQTAIENVSAEEEECYDILPESLRDSERGEIMSNAIENLQLAYDGCEELISFLMDAKR